jgi:hypothetical protein
MPHFTMGGLTASQARSLNEMWEAVEQFRRLSVAPPLSLTRAGGTPVIRSRVVEPVLGEITASDGATPPAYTAKRMTRDGYPPGSNAVKDYTPQELYYQCLSPTSDALSVGDRVQLVPVADMYGWYWAFPAAAGGGSATSARVPIKARVCATGNVSVSSPPTNVYDGVTLAPGDVIFLPFQAAAAENGPYVFNGVFSALTRHTDADTSDELVICEVVVSEGTKNADTKWLCTTNAPITVDTTALNWERTYPAQVFAIVTVTDTGSGHTVKERTWGGGPTSTSPADGSPTVTYSPCYSTTGTALPVNSVVTVDRHPIIPGAYRITPAGYAASGLPGLMSATTQTVSGQKSFVNGVQVGPDSATVGLYPDAGSWTLPTSYGAAGLTAGETPSGDYIALRYLDSSDSSVILQGPVSSSSSHPLWVVTDYGAGAGVNHGLFILVGNYAVYDPSTTGVQTGKTGTLLANATAFNGIVNSLGAKLLAVSTVTPATVTGTGDDTDINNNFTAFATAVNAIIARLQSAGITF